MDVGLCLCVCVCVSSDLGSDPSHTNITNILHLRISTPTYQANNQPQASNHPYLLHPINRSQTQPNPLQSLTTLELIPRHQHPILDPPNRNPLRLPPAKNLSHRRQEPLLRHADPTALPTADPADVRRLRFLVFRAFFYGAGRGVCAGAGSGEGGAGFGGRGGDFAAAFGRLFFEEFVDCVHLWWGWG